MKPKFTIVSPGSPVQSLSFALGLLCATIPTGLQAQAPCPDIEPFATGLARPDSWTPVEQPGVSNAGQISVTIPPTAGNKFFRLKAP